MKAALIRPLETIYPKGNKQYCTTTREILACGNGRL